MTQRVSGAENRILCHPASGRVPLTESERQKLAEMGTKRGKKALEEIGQGDKAVLLS